LCIWHASHEVLYLKAPLLGLRLSTNIYNCSYPVPMRMRRRTNITDIDEVLEVIKALEDADADYWGPPSSQKESKGQSVFDATPAKFGAFDETDDWLPPPPSKSKSKPKDKDKGKDDQPVRES
jgi:hypothetical protein